MRQTEERYHVYRDSDDSIYIEKDRLSDEEIDYGRLVLISDDFSWEDVQRFVRELYVKLGKLVCYGAMEDVNSLQECYEITRWE